MQQAVRNNIPFKFPSSENMKFVKLTLEKEFVMPLKGNRKVATSVEAKQERRDQQVAECVNDFGPLHSKIRLYTDIGVRVLG